MQAIKAYDQGLLGMCRNEKRVLIAPPHLAYGDRGIPGVIPEKATLRFTVQLLEFLNKKKVNEEKENADAKSELWYIRKLLIATTLKITILWYYFAICLLNS